MLILVCGLPGSGKTTLAKALAKRHSALHLSSDIVRKEMLAKPAYGEEEKQAVYGELAARAERALGGGKSVIVDATFYKAGYRELMLGVAARAGVKAHVVVCTLPEPETAKRLAGRKPGSMSDADYGIYLKLKAEFEPVSGEHVDVDASLPLEKRVAAVEKFLGGL